MSDTFKPISGESSATGANYGSSGSAGASTYSDAGAYDTASSNEAGKTLLAGVVGGVASAIGYIVYSRLPDQQKERLQQQVRALVEARINELRSRFNL